MARQVSFKNIFKSYIVGTNIKCFYTIGSHLPISSWDWVGLFKLGWKDTDKYIHYEWSTKPQNRIVGREVENSVVFHGELHNINLWMCRCYINLMVFLIFKGEENPALLAGEQAY